MSDSTLAAIKKKVRRLTASPSTNQLSDADLEEYIDTFYEQDLPSHLKTWNLHSTATFFTEPNVDEYVFDTEQYQAIVPPVYIDGYQVIYSQSREEFFGYYPFISTAFTGPSGDGSAGPYAFTVSSLPALRGSVVVSAIDTGGAPQIVRDVPQPANNAVGDLVDSDDGVTVRGTINYITGAVSVTFSNTIPATEPVLARYNSYKASRPTAVLLFKDRITLRPVPDKVYMVSYEVYQRPSVLFSTGGHPPGTTPDVAQWWQYIALGAAIKVFQDRQDITGVQSVLPFFKEQEALILYRTATQQASERTQTIYSGGGNGGALNGQFGAY